MRVDTFRRYLDAIEAGTTGDALAAFFTDDGVFEELPNRLNPNGSRRDLPTILASAEQGKHVVASQRYVILSAIEQGDRLAAELEWTATLKVAIGSLAAGDPMRARFGVFVTFVGDRIQLQRNYDCFDPF